MAGIPWMFSVLGAVASDFERQSHWLLVPAIGPWLMLAAGGGKNDCSSSTITLDGFEDSPSCKDRAGLRSVLVLDGMLQTGGAVMVILGITIPKKRLVREHVTVSVLPTPMGRAGYGAQMVGSF